MDFAFTTEQLLLQDSARAFFAGQGDSRAIRALMESDAGYAAEVWRTAARDLGWAALAIPEDRGGLGLGMVEIAIIQEQLGYALYPLPFLATVGLAIPALLAAASTAQLDALLPAIAAGEMTASLAYCGGAGVPDKIDAVLDISGTQWRLSGESGFVPFGHAVDLLIIVARTADGAVSLVALPRTTPGVVAERIPYLDYARATARLKFENVVVPPDAVLGSVGAGASALRAALDNGMIALAAEQVGGIEKCIDMSTEYAKQRVAFGRAIGGFQAVKHLLADMIVNCESARSAAYYAACIADEGHGNARAEAAITASIHCADTFYKSAASAIQVHGGMGFTWEHDAHLYFKHARCTQSMFGDPTDLCARLAGSMGLS